MAERDELIDMQPAERAACTTALDEAPPRTWLMLGHKAGDNGQIRALAEALGWPINTLIVTRTLVLFVQLINRVREHLLELFEAVGVARALGPAVDGAGAAEDDAANFGGLHALEQVERVYDVGAVVAQGLLDGLADVEQCGEVHNGVEASGHEDVGQRRLIGEVAANITAFAAGERRNRVV